MQMSYPERDDYYETITVEVAGVYDSLFSLAFWVFAHHYYKSALFIELMLEKTNPQTKMKQQ